jgi:hypothetical protein
MAFVHYLFLGHFGREGERVRFLKGPTDRAYRPEVNKPLDIEAIKLVLQEVRGTDVSQLDFPEDWLMWFDDGYLICDKYTKDQDVIKFVSRLVERTRCDIYDVAAHSDIALGDWLTMMHNFTKP